MASEITDKLTHVSPWARRMSAVLSMVALVSPALCEVIEVDVSAWADVGTGTTADGWTLGGISRYSDGATRLGKKDDYVLSPDFSNAVTQVVMRVKSSNVTLSRYLTLTPTISKLEADELKAVPSTSLTNETFCWELPEGVRQFRMQNLGTGRVGWGITSLTVYTDRIETPTGLWDDPLYCDAFVVGWDGTVRAVRYQSRCASVTRVPPQFDTVAAWDFSSLTNIHGNTWELGKLKDEFIDVLGGLSGTNVCMQKYESGHIQVGKGEKLGCLVLPMPPVRESTGEMTGILRAWKYPANGKPTMPIYMVANGVTNDLATVELTDEKSEYRFQIPEGFAAESVILSSATNGIALTNQNGRVRIESFAVVSGYVPGSVLTNDFKMSGAQATKKLLKGLEPGEWVWSVRSFDANGRDSPWSQFRTVILVPQRPRRPRPGFVLSIR